VRQTPARAARLLALPLLGLLLAVTGCGGDADEGETGRSVGSTRADGYAEQVRTETDQVAGELIPALVDDLGVSVTPGIARFLECDLTGWRYTADVDLFLPAGADQAGVPAAVVAAMQQVGLEVEERDDDDTVLGRRGELSVLLGKAAGPEQRPFRHLSLTHACASYSDADVEVAESADSTDYTSLIPPAAVYAPAG
jgi:hypothetical protein